MMNLMKKSALAAGVAVALTGCVTSSGTTYHIDDPYLFFGSAARSGAFPVVILGQPYPGRQPAVEAAVADGFSRTFNTFPRPAMVPSADVRSQRLVVVFNVPGHPLPRDICEKTAQMTGGTGGAGDTVSASAVYCGGVEPYSSAWVALPAPAGPDTAEFRNAMATLIREAIPREIDPSRRHSNDAPGVPS
jgi:hypothetical protein